MGKVLTEAGEIADKWAGAAYLTPDALSAAPVSQSPHALDLETGDDPDALVPWFGAIGLIRIRTGAFSDGRVFSQARRLRSLGYAGRLRLAGPVISDQMRALIAVGFDEIELPDAIAARQPNEHWTQAARPSYQSRLLAD